MFANHGLDKWCLAISYKFEYIPTLWIWIIYSKVKKKKSIYSTKICVKMSLAVLLIVVSNSKNVIYPSTREQRSKLVIFT